MTMGIVVVARLARKTGAGIAATINSTSRRTSSNAKSSNRSDLPGIANLENNFAAFDVSQVVQALLKYLWRPDARTPIRYGFVAICACARIGATNSAPAAHRSCLRRTCFMPPLAVQPAAQCTPHPIG